MNIPKNHKIYGLIMIFQILLILVVLIGGFIITNNILSVVPAITGIMISIILAFILSEYYYSGAIFKCPECGKVFKPSRKDFMKSVHVSKGRKFQCPDCNKLVCCKEGFVHSEEFK